MEHNQVIDPDEIIIEPAGEEPPDRLFDVCLPAACVKSIIDRLTEARQSYEGERLFNLLVEICSEEAKGRYEFESLWGAASLRKPTDPMPTPDADFKFRFVIDVLSDIEWPDWSTLEFERPTMEISDDMVESELREQCFDAGETVISEDPLKPGDDALVNATFIPNDGADRSPAVELVVRVPSPEAVAVLDGLQIPELGLLLSGSISGAVFDCAHPAGTGLLSIEVVECRHRTPGSIDDVLKKYGTPSETILRTQIRRSLESRFKAAQEANMTQVVFDRLLEEVEFPVSEALVRRRLFDEAQKQGKALQSQGLSPDKIREELEGQAPAARERVRAGSRRSTLTAMLRREFEKGASESEIKEEIQNLAAAHGRRPEELRREIIDAGQIDVIASRVFERKIAAEIINRAKIVDVAVSV